MNELIIFEGQDVKLEVNVRDDTVWLDASQMAKLFDRDVKTIRKHINNALNEELLNEVVVAKFAHTTQHGSIEGKTQTRYVDFYNLDMIISVGYRVKSKRGIEFRRWASSVLKDYLLKGYSINQKRLEFLEKTVQLIDIANRVDSDESKNLLNVIGEYSKALDILDDYDHRCFIKYKGNISCEKISYDDCLSLISQMSYGEKSNIFGLERNNGLSSIINDIYQSFDGKDIYLSIEEKAANFLYFLVKNHVFIDGNKRIAAVLFIYFLYFYDILEKNNKRVIDNNSLAAITLLIAESNPKEKEIMVDLVLNFLCR